MGFSLSPQGFPGMKGSRGHRGEEGEPVSFSDSLPSTLFLFPLKKPLFSRRNSGVLFICFLWFEGWDGLLFSPFPLSASRATC